MSEIISSDKTLLAPLFHLELVRDRDIPYDGNLKTSEGAAQVLHNLLDRSPTEQMVVLYLDSDTNLVGAEKVGMGGIEQVATRPTEIFRGAIVKACPEIILGHNHPVGDGRPSVTDLKMTMSMVDIGFRLGVRVRDHIIVVPNGKHMSIRESLNSHLLDKEMDQMRDEMMADSLGLSPETMKGLKEKMMQIIKSRGVGDPLGGIEMPSLDGHTGKKGGDPKANMTVDWTDSLTHDLLMML